MVSYMALELKQAHRWSHIIIHHSLTKDNKTLSWDDIKRYHTQTNGWKDIGYHFGIEQIEDSYQILVGRSILEDGAHTVGMNEKALGVMLCGNFDITEPTDEMLKHLCHYLLVPLMALYVIPIENVQGHHVYANKSCPGNKFPWMKFIKILSEEKAQYY